MLTAHTSQPKKYPSFLTITLICRRKKNKKESRGLKNNCRKISAAFHQSHSIKFFLPLRSIPWPRDSHLRYWAREIASHRWWKNQECPKDCLAQAITWDKIRIVLSNQSLMMPAERSKSSAQCNQGLMDRKFIRENVNAILVLGLTILIQTAAFSSTE